jgi:hypothetical protein
MAPIGESEINQAAYLRLKDKIDSTYPKDRFVAIHGGQIVADAESFEVIRSRLDALGLQSRNVLVVQSGEETGDLVIL